MGRADSHSSQRDVVLDLVEGAGKDEAVRWLLVLVVGSAACGDDLLPPGAALAASDNLTIVAHQDDDLLFMQPDLADIADRRQSLTNVYVTAGNATGGVEIADKRNAGLMEAYAEASGVESEWTCGTIDLADHAAEHCRLAGAPISLVFLAYPDGGKEGEQPDSLLHLFDGSIASTTTIARDTARYDRDGLIATVAEVIDATNPRTIRTLEIAATHGRDHADHMMVGALTLLAVAESGSGAELLSFRGYATENEPENVIDPLYDRSANNLAHYHACASDCGTCGTACPTIDDAHATWMRRRYAVGLRTNLVGSLGFGDRCVQLHPMTGQPILGGECARHDDVALTAGGRIFLGDRCMVIGPDDMLVTAASCAPEAAHRFFLDDDGVLWSGAPAPPTQVTAGQHLRCVVPDGDRLRVAPCGDGNAPTWTLARHATTIARPSWLPSTGRAVRIFNNQLYTVINGDLVESVITETGLSAPVTIGALAVEPESLVVASLESGKLRACGRDADGILCGSIYASYTSLPYTLDRWSPAFARTGPVTPGDRSLAAVGAEVCGLTDEGVICAPRGPTFQTAVRSRWPRPDTTLWVGDLDGDRQADWCAATAGGVACGRDADRALTDDGVPWSFALGGAADPAPASSSVGALYDIDGDDRADLCTIDDRQIMCARSQGHGFGPRVSIGTLPPGGTATGLWFYPDHACVDDGTALACVVLPQPPTPI